MFSPQSYQTNNFNLEQDNNKSLNNSNISDNDDEINQSSHENIVYQTEDYNVNNSRSSNNELTISYFGIKGNSILGGILNISASTIGAGCLSFPWIISSLGLLNSMFLFSIVTRCIYFSI